MSATRDQSGKSPDPDRGRPEAEERNPIFHPSQAEGERGPSQGADRNADEAEKRPRPSQAEGERDEKS